MQFFGLWLTMGKNRGIKARGVLLARWTIGQCGCQLDQNRFGGGTRVQISGFHSLVGLVRIGV
jgi:hypothetical protein